jgi:hypothetical protein
VLPLHGLVFNGLLQGIADAAERRPAIGNESTITDSGLD